MLIKIKEKATQSTSEYANYNARLLPCPNSPYSLASRIVSSVDTVVSHFVTDPIEDKLRVLPSEFLFQYLSASLLILGDGLTLIHRLSRQSAV